MNAIKILKACKIFSCRFYSIICFFNQNKPSDQSNRSNFSHGTLVLEPLMCKSTTSEKDSLALASPRLPCRHQTSVTTERRIYLRLRIRLVWSVDPPPLQPTKENLICVRRPFPSPPPPFTSSKTHFCRTEGRSGKGGKESHLRTRCVRVRERGL